MSTTGTFDDIAKRWLPLAVVIVILCALVDLAVQQDMRIGANDPQIQLSEDTAGQLQSGLLPTDAVKQYMVSNPTVNIASSLAPFITIYDSANQSVSQSGELNGKPLQLPQGVFDYARKYGQERLTLEPQPGVRIAAVITSYGHPIHGYVLAGRSLLEIEKRESSLNAQVMLALLAALLGSFMIILLYSKNPETK